MNYQGLKLEKGMYNVSSKSFTKVLEELDPSKNYENTDISGLDAYQRQLKRYDIKVSGANSDTVEKFFSTTNAAVLFPEYISRAVHQGISDVTTLDDIIATKTKIEGMDYRSITSSLPERGVRVEQVLEGSNIPVTKINLQTNLIPLKKRGRVLEATYESIRYQRLDLFTVTLKQIGAYIAKAQLRDAVNVLLNGDGNNNASVKLGVATVDTLTYNDLLKLWDNFNEYNFNTMLVSPDAFMKLLAISEFRDPATGLNFQATGKLSTPMGASLIRSTAVPANHIIGLDKNFALEMVSAGDIEIEYDKLIDKQIQRAAVTATTGFAKIFKDATVALNISTAG
ncbi:MAG: phage major capsid protein [Oscillospiraceae bacterium]|nr:phage major capsid protein [Oscillospiraceae bacterium]